MKPEQIIQLGSQLRKTLFGWSSERVDRFMTIDAMVRRNALGDVAVTITPVSPGRVRVYGAGGASELLDLSVDEACRITDIVLTDRFVLTSETWTP